MRRYIELEVTTFRGGHADRLVYRVSGCVASLNSPLIIESTCEFSEYRGFFSLKTCCNFGNFNVEISGSSRIINILIVWRYCLAQN